MKLGTQWETKTNFRRLKDPGSITFHVASIDVRKTITFFTEDNKPIRETDALFQEYMQKWEELKQKKYEAKNNEQEALQKGDKAKALELAEITKKADEEAYNASPSIKFFIDIINRQTEEKEILEMTPGTAKKLNDYFIKGFTSNSHDFILENTGQRGINKYTLTPAPTKKPFTEKELTAIGMVDAVEVTEDTKDIPF